MWRVSRKPRVEDAESGVGLDHVRQLLRTYADEFAESLLLEGYEEELAGLPGRYARPSGCLLLATLELLPAGCVSMARLDEDTCEMKRLFVDPGHRGRGVGRLLVEEVVSRAERAGYRRMVLDTVPEMVEAIALYRAQGFVPTDRFWDCPVERPIYLEKRLQGWNAR